MNVRAFDQIVPCRFVQVTEAITRCCAEVFVFLLPLS